MEEDSLSPVDSSENEQENCNNTVTLNAKWGNQEFRLEVKTDGSETIGDLKIRLYSLTNVKPWKQKIFGLSKQTGFDDETPLSQINLNGNKRFMMIGTPEDKMLKSLDPSELPDVFNDFDYDVLPDFHTVKAGLHHRKKIDKIIKEREIVFMHSPRQGRKLLVMDLDYTLFDMKSHEKTNCLADLIRPYTEDFMKIVYRKWDIAVWSQTSWKWLEMKLTEMGLLTHSDFRISFVLDQTFMVKVTTKEKDGKERTHEVKPLEVIWIKYPQYFSPRNTLHVDDLGRNFILNAQNGLKIKAFKHSLETRHSDMELYYLAQYLDRIGDLDDLSALNHQKWKSYMNFNE